MTENGDRRALLASLIATWAGRVGRRELAEAVRAWADDPEASLEEVLERTGVVPAGEGSPVPAPGMGSDGSGDGDPTRAVASAADPGAERTVVESRDGREAPWEVVEVAELQVEHRGRYTGGHLQGQGGMGRVLRVRDRHLGREVALKEMVAEAEGTGASLGDLRRRFLQEARITGRLEHPSIVPVHELGCRGDGRLYYTMKLVRGETLGAALRRTAGLGDRLQLLPRFVDLCQAVAYAHSKGVIHRDLKPDNVLLGSFGETVVIDWGLAKARGVDDVHAVELERTTLQALPNRADVLATGDGDALGTPAYMAPEQAAGEIHRVDERSDIYALGVILYEILTGRPPFRARTLAEMLAKVKGGEAVDPRKLEQATPPEVAAICRRAMARSADERYQTASELAAEVERFLSGALVEAYSYRLGEHWRRFVSRHRAVVATVAGALLVVLAVMVGATWWNLRERHRAELQATRAVKVSGFISDMLEQLDPRAGRGGAVTVSELLDTGAAIIDRDLAGQPEDQAALYLTIGNLYHEVGAYDRAVALIERSVELRDALVGDHPDTADSLLGLARAERARNRLDAAEAAIERCLAIRERALGPDHPEVAAALAVAGTVFRMQGRFDLAETTYARALAIRERAFGPDHEDVASVLHSLGFLHHKVGRLDEAEGSYRRALAVRERCLGAASLEVAATTTYLANLLQDLGELDEAEVLYRRALEIRRQRQGRRHPQVATVMNSLGVLLARTGRHAEAESLLADVLAIREEVLGPDHPEVAASLDALAIQAARSGRLDAAEELFKRSLEVRRRALGGEHLDVATTLANLANFYLQRGRAVEASRRMAEASAIAEAALGGGHRRLAWFQRRLAEMSAAAGLVVDAERAFERALEIEETAVGSEAPSLAPILEAYASFLETTDRAEEASRLRARVDRLRDPAGE